jgi:PAS domain S-box-containing protein
MRKNDLAGVLGIDVLGGRQLWKIDVLSPVHGDWEECHRQIQARLPLKFPLVLRMPDGNVRHIELRGRPVTDAQGEFCGYRGTGRDESPFVQSTRALRELEVRHREMVNHLREVIFRIDARGRFTYLNRAWEDLTGQPASMAIGRHVLGWLSKDEARYLLARLEPMLDGRRDSMQVEVRTSSRGESARWLEIAVSARFGSGGKLESLAGSIDDITQRKQAEATLYDINTELERRVKRRTAELEASNRELEAFSYSVSHDLRNPLRAIDGFSQIIIEDYGDQLDAVAHSHLSRIRAASQKLSRLIDDLLELGRLTRAPISRIEVDLSALARSIGRELHEREPDGDVRLTIGLHLMARVDPMLARVLIEHLLRNAWAFTTGTDASGNRVRCAPAQPGSRVPHPRQRRWLRHGTRRAAVPSVQPPARPDRQRAAPASDWPPCSASCTGTAAASGRKAFPARVRPSTSRCLTRPTEKLAETCDAGMSASLTKSPHECKVNPHDWIEDFE